MKTSSTFVIIGLVLVIATYFVLNNQPDSKPQQTTQAETINPNLEKVDGDVYTFYYPKGFVKLDKDMGSSEVLHYSSESKKDTREGITLNMYPVPERMKTPTSEFCMELLKLSLSNPNVLRIVDAKPVDFIRSHGCDFMYIDENVPGKLSVHERYLWYKEGDNLNTYGSTASYLLTSSQAERDILDLAVNSFILK